jgi:hypothetical protein
MAKAQETKKNTAGSPASPGDNRSAGDPDGNRTAAGGKAPGPREPQAPSEKKRP